MKLTKKNVQLNQRNQYTCNTVITTDIMQPPSKKKNKAKQKHKINYINSYSTTSPVEEDLVMRKMNFSGDAGFIVLYDRSCLINIIYINFIKRFISIKHHTMSTKDVYIYFQLYNSHTIYLKICIHLFRLTF